MNIEEDIKELTETKANEMNPDALYHCISVLTIIKQINDYIEGGINLCEERIPFF